MRVLIHNDRPEPLRERLLELVPDVEVGLCDSYDGLVAVTRAFEPEVQFHIRFEDKPYPVEAVFDVRGLRWLGVGGVGVDHLGPWDPEAVTVTNGAGVASEALAWQDVGHVWGKTVCVVGLGHIGRDIAKLCKAVGFRVVGTRANPQPTDNVDQVFGPDGLHKALAEADYVAVCTPKVPSTIGLIDGAAFAAMKPGACLIDVSRGGVTLADQLMAALDSGHLAGASLDVFDPEPMPADHPIWDREDVMITPHSCATFDGWELKALDMFADNLKRLKAGQPLFNVVDPVRGY